MSWGRAATIDSEVIRGANERLANVWAEYVVDGRARSDVE